MNKNVIIYSMFVRLHFTSNGLFRFLLVNFINQCSNNMKINVSFFFHCSHVKTGVKKWHLIHVFVEGIFELQGKVK